MGKRIKLLAKCHLKEALMLELIQLVQKLGQGFQDALPKYLWEWQITLHKRSDDEKYMAKDISKGLL